MEKDQNNSSKSIPDHKELLQSTELENINLRNQLELAEKREEMELEVNRLHFEMEVKHREMMLERELSRNNISIIFAKFFVWFISICVSFMFTGAIASGFGADIKWEVVTQNILEIIKIAVLPVAMLVLGFHFGSGTSSRNIADKLSGLYAEIEKKSNKKKSADD